MKYRLIKEKLIKDGPAQIISDGINEYYKCGLGNVYFNKWYDGEEYSVNNKTYITIHHESFDSSGISFYKWRFNSEKDYHDYKFNNKIDELLK